MTFLAPHVTCSGAGRARFSTDVAEKRHAVPLAVGAPQRACACGGGTLYLHALKLRDPPVTRYDGASRSVGGDKVAEFREGDPCLSAAWQAEVPPCTVRGFGVCRDSEAGQLYFTGSYL